MEVDGDLKVTGQIDASNQRIKNVAPPSNMTDAVNAPADNAPATPAVNMSCPRLGRILPKILKLYSLKIYEKKGLL